MTSYYLEGGYLSIVSFETDPQDDINADAKVWHPATDRWVDCSGSTGIGASVKWSTDYYPIPESAVEEMQERCRERFKEFKEYQAQRKAAAAEGSD